MSVWSSRILLSAITVTLGFLSSDNRPFRLKIVEVASINCIQAGSPCEVYWRAEAVFAGKVIGQSTFYFEEVHRNSRYRHQQISVRFLIEQAFRGISGSEVEIVTGTSGDRGYEFKDGESYVVYARRYGPDKRRLYADNCNRIKLMADAEEDLEYFRALPPPDSGGAVFGSVRKLTMFLSEDGRYQETYLSDIKISVEGNGKRFETVTDNVGHYRFSGLAPGRYTINADLPEEQNSHAHDSVEVIDRGCTASDFYAQPNGQVSGRVFDAKGAPLPNIVVDLVLASDVQNDTPKSKRRVTDNEGRYKFEWIPPGSYYIGVGVASGFGNLCPYPPIYMPDVEDVNAANVVRLNEGQKLEDQNISLPSVDADLEFEVEIVWPDGSPAVNAVMTLHGDGNAVFSTGQKDLAGRPGVYRVKSYRACSYWLNAYTYGHPGEPEPVIPRHGEVKIDSSANFTKPVRVTISQPGFMCDHQRPKY
jgi:hypothetical protein